MAGLCLAFHFSKLLKNWVNVLAKSDKNKPLKEQGLPAELEKAVVACNGSLMPNYAYIPLLRQEVLNNLAKKEEGL